MAIPSFGRGGEKEEKDFQSDLADSLAKMPDAPLSNLLPSATSWLQRRRETLAANDGPDGARVLRLWDRLADLTYESDEGSAVADENDLVTQALNEPGGILASILLDSLISSKPKAGSGLGPELAPRFDRVARARGRAGFLVHKGVQKIPPCDALASPERRRRGVRRQGRMILLSAPMH